MTPQEMKERTKEFALRVIRASQALPKGGVPDVLGRQLLRSGTNVGANYRAACRARSNAEFVAKVGLVEEEADESLYWMELLIDAGPVEKKRMEPLMKEANELVSIMVASVRTARAHKRRAQA